MLKIEKIISRDIPLINIYAWHKGYTTGMKKWLGWGYSDTLFYVHDNYVDIMRPPSDHLVKFKNILYKKADAHSGWFNTESHNFIKLTSEILRFYSMSLSEIDTCSYKRIWAVYLQYVDYVSRVMGPFISMTWFPMFCENDQLLQKKYKQELRLAVAARKKSELIFPRGDELIMKIISRIAVDSGLSIELLKVMDYQEFQKYLSSNVNPPSSLLLKRSKGFIFSKKGIQMVNKGVKNIKKAFSLGGYIYKEDPVNAISELKGSSACPGLVKGKVRVIMTKNKISELKRGEILVTAMTTPEYLPAMRKATAFVTDEGGITCHAAIVAREMGKPCIIGTKFATKVLKNGDMVEVNANRGIIKIL